MVYATSDHLLPCIPTALLDKCYGNHDPLSKEQNNQQQNSCQRGRSTSERQPCLLQGEIIREISGEDECSACYVIILHLVVCGVGIVGS